MSFAKGTVWTWGPGPACELPEESVPRGRSEHTVLDSEKGGQQPELAALGRTSGLSLFLTVAPGVADGHLSAQNSLAFCAENQP